MFLERQNVKVKVKTNQTDENGKSIFEEKDGVFVSLGVYSSITYGSSGSTSASHTGAIVLLENQLKVFKLEDVTFGFTKQK
jgi:hypothetical protein